MERDLLNREIKSLGVGIGRFPMQSMEFEKQETSIFENPNKRVLEAAIIPFGDTDKHCLYIDILNEVENRNAQNKNKTAFEKYGVFNINIMKALNSYVDKRDVDHVMSNVYPNLIVNEDSLLAEMIHQFQSKIFSDSEQWNGIIGPSVLSSLGFVFHKNKGFKEDAAYKKVKDLYRDNVVLLDAIEKYKLKLNMPRLQITGKNWFNYIINPSIFGWNGDHNRGFHLLLILELRKAEKELFTQLRAELISEFKQNIVGKNYNPSYKHKSHYLRPGGFVPRILGKILGIKQAHKDTRTKNSPKLTMSFHFSGLAIDINYTSNPWVRDNKGLVVLRNAAPNIVITQADTAQVYFKEIAIRHNNKTNLIYDDLNRINNLCKSYHARFSASKKIDWGLGGRINRECFGGFLDHKKELVVTLREKIGMAWLAVDIGIGDGDGGNGDMMHFDMRTSIIGLAYLKAKDGKKVTEKSSRQEYLESIGWKFADT